jgi:hypothetical protein
MFRDINLRLSVSTAYPTLVCHHGEGVLLKKTEYRLQKKGTEIEYKLRIHYLRNSSLYF